MVVIVMGVAGSGKTTIASLLAEELGWDFLDADSIHSPANVAKMESGIPLNDADRVPWLRELRLAIERSLAEKRNLALACSALKRSYRQQLMVGSEIEQSKIQNSDVKLVYLKGTFEELRQRLQHRTGHFMTEQLLGSQLETLEEPSDATTVDAGRSPQEIVAEIRRQLGLR